MTNNPRPFHLRDLQRLHSMQEYLRKYSISFEEFRDVNNSDRNQDGFEDRLIYRNLGYCGNTNRHFHFENWFLKEKNG